MLDEKWQVTYYLAIYLGYNKLKGVSYSSKQSMMTTGDYTWARYSKASLKNTTLSDSVKSPLWP